MENNSAAAQDYQQYGQSSVNRCYEPEVATQDYQHYGQSSVSRCYEHEAATQQSE